MTHLSSLSLTINTITIALAMMVSVHGSGAAILGPSSVETGSTHTYFYDDGNSGYNPVWTVSGGTVLSSGFDSFEGYYAVVQWGATAGSGSITFRNGILTLGKLTVAISTATPPGIPDMPTITNYPGYTRLTRGTPPVGETWYWQDTSTGTSTSNSAQYVDKMTGTVHYLRSYNGSTSLWSPTLTVNYTIDPLPTAGLSDENYVHTIVPQVGTTDVSLLANGDKMESVTYYDGLGRPMQNIEIRAGGAGEDIITHIGYDGFGRQDREYLPYSEVSYDGAYRTGAGAIVLDFYDTVKYEGDFPGMATVDINPYSETHFEASPLNRVLEQGAPGTTWKVDKTSDADHTIKFGYEVNTTNEVRFYEVDLSVTNNTYIPTLTGGTGYYGAGELYRTVTRDENWTSGTAHTTEEFKDKQGRVVLKRTYGDSDVNGDGDTLDAGETNIQHDTYYVYDDYGNLTYVLPPKSEAHTAKPDATELAELCYQYKYDHRNRLVEKKIPGKGLEYIVYNKIDLPIMTQDTNMKNQGQWLVTKYDAFGRVVYTAIKSSTGSRTYLQSTFDADTVPSITHYEKKVASGTGYLGTYYTSTARPTAVDEILTINYYDDYTFDKDGMTLPSTAEGQPIVNHDNATATRTLTKGLATGSKVRVLGTSDWITTVTGYDAKGRPIYVASKNNYLSTVDIVTSELDFVGKVKRSSSSHTRGKATTTIVDVFGYDDTGRLTAQRQQIGTQPEETIVENSYDDLGQLVNKGVGGLTSANGRLQTVDYNYNIRGWLKGINDTANLGGDLFAFGINYNTVGHSGTALFNGNIAETEWRTANTDDGLKWYAYGYDALNRIISAAGSSSNYDLGSVAYDRNGNITSLYRMGHTDAMATVFGGMDVLAYTYDTGSNRLKKVQDNGADGYGFRDGADLRTEYTYDANGNMVFDANKDIASIAYNHLNLPTRVDFEFDPTETVTYGDIVYVYDATGTKLSKTVSKYGPTIHINPKVTLYAGNYVYEDGQVAFISQPEGYAEPDGNGNFGYIYQYKDHLGNIRLSYKDVSLTSTPQLEIIEENNYYPFGLKHKGYNNVINGTDHPYGFNGKEEQNELDLNWHDFGARNYDAALGRWMNIDNLAEDYYNYSPYTYTANNPIYYIDPDGQQIIIHYKDEDGNDQQHVYEYGGKYDGDNQFIKDVYAGLNYLIDNDADTTGLIKKLSGDELGDVSVLENTKENNPLIDDERYQTYFNSETNTIIWDPEVGASQEQNSVLDWIMGDGYKHEALVSPAESLLHELGHAESSLEDPEQHKKDSKYPMGGGYDNKEEFDVITKIENPAGRKLKRDRTRNAHRGRVIRTVSPTSVKEKKKKKS